MTVYYDNTFMHEDGRECRQRDAHTWHILGQGWGPESRCNRAHDSTREPDPVNKPNHYRWLPVEAIEITELFNFNLGNALKYIIRADHKGKPIEDLEKARWYLDRELQRRAKQ